MNTLPITSSFRDRCIVTALDTVVIVSLNILRDPSRDDLFPFARCPQQPLTEMRIGESHHLEVATTIPPLIHERCDQSVLGSFKLPHQCKAAVLLGVPLAFQAPQKPTAPRASRCHPSHVPLSPLVTIRIRFVTSVPPLNSTAERQLNQQLEVAAAWSLRHQHVIC